MTAMSRGSPSSAVCRARSFMTTPGLRWPAFSVTASAQRTRVFSELRSHYLFEDRFGRPGKGNDKGKVEGIVGYCRRNFTLVPMPSRSSNFDDAQHASLKPAAPSYGRNNCVATTRRSANAWNGNRAVLQRLPAIACDACDKRVQGWSVRCRWCASRHRLLRRPHTVRPLRGASAAMSRAWSSVARQR